MAEDAVLVLTRDERDRMLKAVKAIERQVKAMSDAHDWQPLYVITANLTIIESNLKGLGRHTPN